MRVVVCRVGLLPREYGLHRPVEERLFLLMSVEVLETGSGSDGLQNHDSSTLYLPPC
jgi:hypothetical protein